MYNMQMISAPCSQGQVLKNDSSCGSTTHTLWGQGRGTRRLQLMGPPAGQLVIMSSPWSPPTSSGFVNFSLNFHYFLPLIFWYNFNRELPWRLRGKESICQCRRHERDGFYPWVRKIPWRRKWQLAPIFLLGQRSLAGYSLWGHKSWTWLWD